MAASPTSAPVPLLKCTTFRQAVRQFGAEQLLAWLDEGQHPSLVTKVCRRLRLANVTPCSAQTRFRKAVENAEAYLASQAAASTPDGSGLPASIAGWLMLLGQQDEDIPEGQEVTTVLRKCAEFACSADAGWPSWLAEDFAAWKEEHGLPEVLSVDALMEHVQEQAWYLEPPAKKKPCFPWHEDGQSMVSWQPAQQAPLPAAPAPAYGACGQGSFAYKTLLPTGAVPS